MDDADDSMTKEHMREVNQAFYRAEPAEYFHMRLTTLGAAIGSPDGLHSLLAPPGVTAYGVTINDDGERPTDASLARYALIESTNIAHHSIETFFRLLLAHASGNECPALAVAWARSPGELKETLESMVLSPDFEDALVVELGQIVFGLDHKVPGQRDRIVACLPLCRDLARMYLDEASVYNSIKHGMAAIAGDAYLAVGDAGTSGSGFAVSGTSIEFLERVPAGQSPAFWRSTTRWVDIRERLAAAIFAMHLIDGMWSLARKRYTGHPVDERLTVYIPEGCRLRDSRDPNSPSMSFSIDRFEERAGARKRRTQR